MILQQSHCAVYCGISTKSGGHNHTTKREQLNYSIQRNRHCKYPHDFENVNELLPENLRGLLTTSAKVSRIIGEKPNKKSSRADGVPLTLYKLLDQANTNTLTVYFNHLIATAH